MTADDEEAAFEILGSLLTDRKVIASDEKSKTIFLFAVNHPTYSVVVRSKFQNFGQPIQFFEL